MKKVCIYITVSLFVGSFSFSAQESSGSREVFNNSHSLFEGTTLIANTEDVVLRKRAHKRKRKIRPRRNGF